MKKVDTTVPAPTTPKALNTPKTPSEASIASKASIRKSILAQRKALSPALMHAHGKAAQARMLSLDIWKAAKQVLLYMPIRNEMETQALLENAWATGKEVLLPRCDATAKGIMHLMVCRQMGDLCAGSYGIPEPDPSLCACLEPEDPRLRPDLAIIPAVAFDINGNRLGYGGGYYDRFLAHDCMAKTCRIGFAHSIQIVEVLPTEAWDYLMHGLCTEDTMLWPQPFTLSHK